MQPWSTAAMASMRVGNSSYVSVYTYLVLWRWHRRNWVSQSGSYRALWGCYPSVFHSILVWLCPVCWGVDHFVLSCEATLTEWLSVQQISSNIEDGIWFCWGTPTWSRSSCPGFKGLCCTTPNLDSEASAQLIRSKFQEGKVLVTLAPIQIEILYVAQCINFVRTHVNVSKFNGNWKSWNQTSMVTQSPAGHSILYCVPSHCFGVLGQLILVLCPTYSCWFGVLQTAWYVSYSYWFGVDLIDLKPYPYPCRPIPVNPRVYPSKRA